MRGGIFALVQYWNSVSAEFNRAERLSEHISSAAGYGTEAVSNSQLTTKTYMALVSTDEKHWKKNQKNIVWGTVGFAEYRLFKTEFEKQNLVPVVQHKED